MTIITLQIPEELGMENEETARFLAAKLYEAGKLTLGKAAEMVGMKKWDFAEILVNYNVYFLDGSATADLDELKKVI